MITEQQEIYLKLAGVSIEDIIDIESIEYIKEQTLKAALYEAGYTSDTGIRELMDSPDSAWQEIAQMFKLKMTFTGLVIGKPIELNRKDIVAYGDLGRYYIEDLVGLLEGANMTEEEKIAYWEENLL